MTNTPRSNQCKGWKTFKFEQSNDNSSNGLKETIVPKPTVKKRFKLCNFEQQIDPKTVEDLAVHSKKISEVELWLNNNVISKGPIKKSAILLITGPTGCGKTTTVKVLCKKLNIEISEWINPVDKDMDYAIGQTSQLLEFLSESRYPSLFSINRPKVILIEDFPNSVVHNPSDFVNVLEKCQECKSSVIFICTDASNLKLNLPQTLFPDEVRQKFFIDNISFNPTSNTLLKKALKRIDTLIESFDVSNLIDQSMIEDIISASMGDIRSAVNQYYFTCLKVPSDILPNTPPIKPSNKRKRKIKNGTKGTILIKNERLSFFHSLGRILNPKQEEKNGSWRLQCNIGALVEEISIQPATFISFIHANYIKYFGDVKDISNAAEILSFSQSFLNKWENRVDVQKYGLWVPIIGLMVHNKHKVSKWNQITAPKKYKRIIDDNIETKAFDMVDRCYYNIINKSNSKHNFKICSW